MCIIKRLYFCVVKFLYVIIAHILTTIYRYFYIHKSAVTLQLRIALPEYYELYITKRLFIA